MLTNQEIVRLSRAMDKLRQLQDKSKAAELEVKFYQDVCNVSGHDMEDHGSGIAVCNACRFTYELKDNKNG